MPASVPPLPTDSLYKFLAIFGLVLIVFAISYPPSQILRIREIEIEANMAIQNSGAKLLDLRNRKITPAIDELDRAIKALPPPVLAKIQTNRASPDAQVGFDEKDLEALLPLSTAMEKFMGNFWDMVQMAQAENSERNAYIEKHKPHRLLVWYWVTVSIVSFLTGTVCGFQGFRLWYHRVQRHQDAILQRQADSAT